MRARSPCAAVASRLAATAVAAVAAGAAPVGTTPAGARSSDVAALQVALRARGLYGGDVDGVDGPGTRAGVRRLQAARGLAVDGIAGPRTRRALRWRGRPRLGARPLRDGDRGWDVAALQFLLATRGFPSGPMDGILGARASAALTRFQRWAGLAVDGVAGAATLARLRGPPPRSSLRFARPIDAAIGDGFGPRGAWMHTGLDLPAPTGTPVRAARGGCVASAGRDDGYGRLVVIAHRAGMTSWYAHLSRIAVRAGACLAAGARVGAVGASGRATGPHLHFELRLRGAAVDPRPALGIR